MKSVTIRIRKSIHEFKDKKNLQTISHHKQFVSMVLEKNSMNNLSKLFINSIRLFTV